MKQLFQLIALNLFGLSALPVIAAISIGMMVLQIAVNKFAGSIQYCSIRKKNSKLENDMWAIE